MYRFIPRVNNIIRQSSIITDITNYDILNNINKSFNKFITINKKENIEKSNYTTILFPNHLEDENYLDKYKFLDKFVDNSYKNILYSIYDYDLNKYYDNIGNIDKKQHYIIHNAINDMKNKLEKFEIFNKYKFGGILTTSLISSGLFINTFTNTHTNFNIINYTEDMLYNMNIIIPITTILCLVSFTFYPIIYLNNTKFKKDVEYKYNILEKMRRELG